jgi:hypothetical protein
LLAQDNFSLPLLINGGLLSANVDWEKQAYGFDINVDQLPLTVTAQGLTLKLDGRYKKQSLSLDFSMDKDWDALAATLQSPLLNATTSADFSGQAMTFDNHVELLSEELLSALLKMPLPSIKTLVVDASLNINERVILEKSNFSLTNDALSVKLGSQWESKKESHKVSVDLAATRSSELGKFTRQIRLNIDNAPDAGIMLANLATRSTVDGSKQKEIPTIDKARWDQVIKDNPWSLSPITIKSDFRLAPDQIDITSLAVDMVGDFVNSHIKGEARFGKHQNDLEVSIDTTLSPGAFALLEEPFSLRGTIGGEGNIHRSTDFLISYRKGTGDLDFIVDSSNSEKPTIKASVTIDDLDLSPLIEQWREGQDTLSADANVGEQKEGAELKTETSKDGKVIPDMPLPTDWLDAATLDVDYKIKRLKLDFLSINEWQGSIALKDGVFNWPQSKLDLLGGDVTFDIMIDSQPQEPHWQLNMLVEKLNPADIRTSKQALLDGPISGRIELNGQGDDLRALMDSLDGRITLGMDDVKLHGANLNSLAPNFLKSTLRILNPFSEKDKDKDKETFFECSVFHALLNSGVMLADDSILARTKETDILASWKLDLTTEEQIIQAYPKQRATIALPTGELAKAIEVSGTLAKPKIGVNTGDLVTGSAKTAFFFVGGWVYVVSKKEWDKRSEEEGACQKARDYWLGNSLAQMKQHQTDKEQKKADKKTARKNQGPARRHSRRPR